MTLKVFNPSIFFPLQCPIITSSLKLWWKKVMFAARASEAHRMTSVRLRVSKPFAPIFRFLHRTDNTFLLAKVHAFKYVINSTKVGNKPFEFSSQFSLKLRVSQWRLKFAQHAWCLTSFVFEEQDTYLVEKLRKW